MCKSIALKTAAALFAGLFLVGLVGCGGSSSSSGTSSSSSNAPSGTVTSVGASSFVIKEPGGAFITVDVGTGTTYQYTVKSSASSAAVGNYVAGLGSVSNGQLEAVDVAFVPVPPSFIPSWEVDTTTQGTVYFGQITAVSGSDITITTGDGSKTIDAASIIDCTLTTSSSYDALKVGENVEVNGPEVTAAEYTGHQINIGLTPAVVGQFD